MTDSAPNGGYAKSVQWSPAPPRFRLLRLALSWLVGAVAVSLAALVLPGFQVNGFGAALIAAALVGVLNAILPPIVAALRLPFTLVVGFLAVLALDAAILLLVSDIASPDIKVDSFGSALLAALLMAAASMALQAIIGVNDEDAYSLRVIERVARRQGEQERTDVPGILFLEIDGLAAPVLRRAIRDGHAPVLAQWLEAGTHGLIEWETDLSSQTGASQAGILLGSNDDIPAFRWVEKETGKLMTCSAPADCAEIERRLALGRGLLIGGGASRGNLLSGEADEVILTVSRMDAEKRANSGYRAFLANGFNVTRELVLFTWEVLLEYSAGIRQRRRRVRPRGERGGRYPFLRAALCVVVRDLIVFGVLTDMMRGRPAVYATFSSYDEVAHHSGLERVDTLEALRKLDQQFGRIDYARRFAPRPYKIVVLSDHGQTQGMTFKQRNGYGLDELVERSLARGSVSGMSGGDEHDAAVGQALQEATGQAQDGHDHDLGDEHAVVLGSGNLGLVY
ncbi:MAG TPA: phage holin family protein, partial [Solirubrobacteraceae bacterium]